MLVELFEREIAGIAPLALIGEALPGGRIVPPRGAAEPDAVWRVKDIELAAQTEISMVKQHLCDQLWALRCAGAQAECLNRLQEGPL